MFSVDIVPPSTVMQQVNAVVDKNQIIQKITSIPLPTLRLNQPQCTGAVVEKSVNVYDNGVLIDEPAWLILTKCCLSLN